MRQNDLRTEDSTTLNAIQCWLLQHRVMDDDALSFDSLAVHAGRGDLMALGVHALPLDLSSTSPLPDIALGGSSYESMAGGGHPTEGGAVYARLWNPTVARFESGLARLECMAEAVAFSSGMAAMTATVLAAKAEMGGSHVVAVRPLYGGTDHLLGSALLGVKVTYCSALEVAASVGPDTCLVVLETPGNPTLELVDVGAVVQAAAGAPVVVDNTFATPVLQNPALQGAALVLHSATKYIGGHGDVVGGGTQRVAERQDELGVQRVALLGPVEREPPHERRRLIDQHELGVERRRRDAAAPRRIAVVAHYLIAFGSMSAERRASSFSGTSSIGVATSATVGPYFSASGASAARSKS